MPNTGFFRASSIEIIGGLNTTGTDNLILDGEGQFNTQIIGGNPDSDPLEVTLNFTDFFIPENNRVTGIEFILEGLVNTGNFVNITAPGISAGTPDEAGQLLTPIPSNVLGVQAGSQTLTYSPANHTYTMDNLYEALEQGSPVEGAINSINSIIGNTPNRVVKLTIPLDALAGGINTLTLVGANGVSQTGDDVGIGLDTSLLPAIRIFYESTLPPPPPTKVLLKGSNLPTDSGARGAVTLITQTNSTSLEGLLNGVGGSSALNPDGFAVLGDIFTSTNPAGDFNIPEDATNIQITINAFGLNSAQGDVRFKYRFSSGIFAPTVIEKVGNPGIQGADLIRTHNDVFTDDGFTPHFWNNLVSISLRLDDSYPFSSNYLIIGAASTIDPTLSDDDVDPSFRLTFDLKNPKVRITNSTKVTIK